MSNRDIDIWKPSHPNIKTVEWLLSYGGQHTVKPHDVSLIVAAAGFHYRSVHEARRLLVDDKLALTVPNLLKTLFPSVGKKCNTADIRRYLDRFFKNGTPSEDSEVYKTVEVNLDINNAFAPAVVCAAYEVIKRDTSGILAIDETNPLYSMFACHVAYTDPAKQLEELGMHFDFFRQQQGMKVVPPEVQVHKTNADHVHISFPANMKKSVEDLFVSRGKPQQVVLTEAAKNMAFGTYFYPKTKNHPHIDRAFVGLEETTSLEWIVLYQDKIDKNLPLAVKSLNLAGQAFKKQFPNRSILCVANVIETADVTIAQAKFMFPYIVVRKSLWNQFYSPTFAHVITYIRARQVDGP
mmetsp:Transcript_14612/g.22241  ORF Transcript_14612/g.22241 Transcript_14612/m.22241 type:complete len:352 (-) Transcript_14612:164-1219(-)|eukprot:CAMPEP_0118679352 /NCGR_PEP_ID=MMETSP0800-20121206/3739_1 /TAXON_ID=210618 ORGANISM="Striatella unipunctata, Strain CCMP2910" /NCGR_SAMPLE_ID=MMETSP0800 /ASSEMBLY_ACC=CAM_ASM_000638 /LENGTH=351 /DNA_ID=CAMNT_0006575335 /DNA_START=314 /DNA_END=1369 /DNA_ORIENTATION=+